MNRKKTTDKFKEEIYNLVENEYSLLGEYCNSKNKVFIIHNKCGNEYWVTLNNFLNGNRCPKCARLKK